MTAAIARSIVVIFEGPAATRASHKTPLLADGPHQFLLLPLADRNPDLSGAECIYSPQSGDTGDNDNDGFPVRAEESVTCSDLVYTATSEWTVRDSNDNDPRSAVSTIGTAELELAGDPVRQSDSFNVTARFSNDEAVVEFEHDTELYISGKRAFRLQWHSHETHDGTDPVARIRGLQREAGVKHDLL